MAEPARRLEPDDNNSQEVYDSSGTAPSDPRPNLKALEGGGETSEPRRGHLREVGEDQPSREDLSGAEQQPNQPDPVRDYSPEGGSFYKKHQKSQKFIDKLSGSNRFKRYLIFGGIGASFIALLIAVISFLSVFKLDGLITNIEQRAFLRHTASLDSRSSKWITAYVEARMLDMGDNPNFDNPDYTKNDNLLFRSNKVDHNNPFFDWYRTLRTGDFEQKVFEDSGIKFTSVVTADGKIRPGRIDINGEKPIPFNVTEISADDFRKLSEGDIKTINKFGDIVDTKIYKNNKEARKAIKETVNNHTRWYEVYKRRFMRRHIQNMTGVRDWRFFENTRDKISDKKIDLRNRMLDKMLPNTGLVANIARCFYGMSKCSPSRDMADPKLEIDSSAILEGDEPDTSGPNEKANKEKLGAQLDAAGISDSLKKILNAANIFTRILNIPDTLDMLSYLNGNLSKLVKLVVVARGAQAAGLFQVMATSRDQIKNGEVSAEEVNAFMQNLDTAGSSDGWVKVVEGRGDPSVAKTGGQCSQQAQALQEKNPEEYKKKYGSYAPLCSDQRIGSADNAQKIQDDYNKTIGQVVRPIVGSWESLNKVPIIGQLIDALRWFSDLISGIVEKIVSQVLQILGLDDNVKAAIAWVFAKTSNFLGLSIIKGYESAGTIMNWIVQGGAFSAETSSRQEGAALTTPESLAASQTVIASYRSDKAADSSLYEKLASLDDADSPAFKGAMALSQVKDNPGGSVISLMQSSWRAASRQLAAVFSPQLYAAGPDGYAASKFAGIESYDYPKQCYNLNPISVQPLDGTNALEIFNKYGRAPSQAQRDALNSWDVERSSDRFYQVIYSVIGEDSSSTDADDIAVQIYNCNLLDTAARGSLGYMYNYNADADSQVIGDIDSTLTSGDNDAPNSNGGPIAEGTNAQLAKKILSYRSTGQYNCDNPGDCVDLQKVVDGQSLAGSDGCIAQTLDPLLLKLILYLIENGGFKIGTFALCGDHHNDGPTGHSGGFAVDISTVDGVAVSSPSAKKTTLKLVRYVNGLEGQLAPRQLISGGFGDQSGNCTGGFYDSALQALEIPSSSFFGGNGGTNACHRNHVHVGY